MRAVVECRRRPTPWYSPTPGWVRLFELNHERQKPGWIDVAATTGRNERDPRHQGGIRLAIQAVIDVKSVRRRHPAAVDEHRRSIVQPQRRDQRHSWGAIEAAARPGALGREIVDTACDNAPLTRTIRCSAGAHLE